MVRIARNDTYGVEDLGGGVRIRRRIVAGTRIPDHYEVSEGDAQERPPSLSEPEQTALGSVPHEPQPPPAGPRAPSRRGRKEPAASAKPHTGTRGAS